MYPQLEETAQALATLMREEAQEAGLALQVAADVGVGHAFVAPEPVTTYERSLTADGMAYRRFAEALLERGVHVIPRGLLYVSTEHGPRDLEETREAVRGAARATVERLRA